MSFPFEITEFIRNDLTETGSSVLIIGGGAAAVMGLGTTLQVKKATASQDGYLSKEDWAAFNCLYSGSTIDPGHKHSKLWASDGSLEAVKVNAAGLVGVRTASPTASLHLPAGVAAASGAPLKFTAGTNLTAPENGAMEYDGTNFYLTSGGVRQTIGFTIGMDHGGLAGLGDDDHTQYLLASGSRTLSGDWDIGASRKISAEAIYARSNAGLKLFEDGGTGIFVQDSTGYVGIGTTGPVAKCDVRGRIAGQSWLNLWNTNYVGSLIGGDARAAITFGATDSYGAWYLGATTNDTQANTKLGVFSWQLGEWLQVWTPDGNIGIWTTVPSYKLDVSGIIRTTGYLIATGGVGVAPIQVTSTTVCANLNSDYLDGYHAAAFALLAGRAGGQTLIGATGSGENLTLQSTSHATKGKIIFGSASAYDEVNDRLGLGTTSPGTRLDLQTGSITARSLVSGTTDGFTIISGGSITSLGSNLVFYGQSHATLSYVFNWRQDTTVVMKLDANINLSLGGAALGTSAANVLGIKAGTAPSTAPANLGQMWVEDINGAAGYAGLHKMTETTALKEIIPGVVIKGTTGRSSNPYPGLIEINEYDNQAYIYADGGWRAITAGW